MSPATPSDLRDALYDVVRAPLPRMDGGGLIELRVNSGLCNRMRAMSSALALARAAGRELTVYWFETGALRCSYRRLFEPIPGVEVVDVRTGWLRAPFDPGAIRLRAAGRRRPHDLFLNGDKIAELQAQGVDLASAAAGARRCGIETYGRFYGSAPYYEDFVPNPLLAADAEEAADSVSGAGKTGRTVGVHIRRGDNDASIQVSPLELFIERMHRELETDPETHFFLATDDLPTERTVTGEFPGRVFARKKDFARDKTRGVQDALVDLLVLARCPLILGSYWSSFSQTAAEWGGARLQIVRTPK